MVNYNDYNDFDKFLMDNGDALDRDLIHGKFTNEQLQIISSWMESAYDQGREDGRGYG
jgi:hypothetical protein